MEHTTLSTAAYAERHGRSYRTVQRYLEAGQLPGAVKIGKRWQIPADALPLEDTTPPAPTGGRALTTTTRTHAPATLAAALDVQPAYLDVDTAAQLLGITAYAVRRHADRFG